MSELITLAEAAQRVGLSVKTLRRAIAEGRLPATRRGLKLIYVDAADLALLDRPMGVIQRGDLSIVRAGANIGQGTERFAAIREMAADPNTPAGGTR